MLPITHALLASLAPNASRHAWPPAGGFAAHADAELQSAFEPWRFAHKHMVWTGGDVGASTRLSSNRVLWIFGDTLIGHWNASAAQRVADTARMPHSSIGIWDLDKPADQEPIAFSWGANESSFFRPEWECAAEAFWAAVAAPDPLPGGTVLVVGHRILYHGSGVWGFTPNETVVFLVDGATERPDEPASWVLSSGIVPHTGNISTAHGWAVVDFGRAVFVEAGYVYLHGQVQLQGAKSKNPRAEVVGRVRWDDLRASSWGAMEFWARPGRGTEWHAGAPFAAEWQVGWTDDLPWRLLPLWAPSTAEAQVQWVKALGAYAVVDIPFLSTFVQIRTARALQGPWSAPTHIYTIPAPFNDTSRYFCYSAMNHNPDHLPAARRAAEGARANRSRAERGGFVFTYVCNGESLAIVYAPGARSVYVPQFVRVAW